MKTVQQHWDPLKVCAVGRSYPPEFYSRIENSKVRNAMEKIAIETEEDYQKLISKLEEFGVTVLRTDISDNIDRCFLKPIFAPSGVSTGHIYPQEVACNFLGGINFPLLSIGVFILLK